MPGSFLSLTLLTLPGKFEQEFKQPEAVADYVYHAFTAKKPRRHYLIGKDAKFVMLIESLPEGLRDWIFYRMIYG